MDNVSLPRRFAARAKRVVYSYRKANAKAQKIREKNFIRVLFLCILPIRMRHKRHYQYIVGIDEVGRGPLAGDVYVGAVIISAGLGTKLVNVYGASSGAGSGAFPGRLADSKKLSPRQRDAWVAWMRRRHIAYAVARVSPAVIDRIRIVRACDLAAGRAYRRVLAAGGEPGPLRVVADGGLSVGNFLRQQDAFDHFPKADERVPAVSLASIVAKVLRDRAMTRLARRYPEYGFDVNKGYGTRKHLKALRVHGATPIHRRTFITGVRVGRPR